MADSINIGYLGPILQELGDQLSMRRVKNIPAHGHLQLPEERFNWIFHNRVSESANLVLLIIS